MLSDSWKSAFKIALENPQKNIAKKYEKTWNCLASLAISKALTINSQFFLSLNIYFGHKTPRGLET